MAKPVRWGVLSTATIAREAVIPAMQKQPYCEHAVVEAIASRSLEMAEATARKFAIPRAYGSYDQLLAEGEIDAVYIPLPNHLHVPYAIKALEAGKHVLCEKPIGLSVEEAEKLVEVGQRFPQLKLMEAFMYRHHPQWQWARRVIDEGKIGELRTIQTFFSYYDVNPNSIHNHPEWGGGGLMDIGCYPISLSRFLFDDEPTRVVGRLESSPKFHVDRLASGIMEFAAGTATFTCSIELTEYQRMIAFGTKGRVEIEIPFNAPADRPCRAWLEVEGSTEQLEFEVCDQYGIQAELFSHAILNDTPVHTPIEDAVANMRVLEAIVRSSENDCWVSVAQ